MEERKQQNPKSKYKVNLDDQVSQELKKIDEI